ncbi:amidase family protein [Conexibacter sp. JD483]|uniref:amidase n=1 Tax=unclassified Conexibacter TaxID=2627773 RepID=UPI002718F023|nr:MULTISPECIES: amidase family protein [unclassified Conexibacter]MDO8186238.1 amidase family protein [Conexibacter sp. CPCC 205706]MDO8199695.1 amidase family protein [Conexibacter sp. CPCC 205762]MDR9368213.1 amidase family protein [Conexibacter sp. JD483]
MRRTRTPIPAVAAAATAALAAGIAAAPASAINYVTSANGASWSVADSAAPGLDTGSLNAAGSNAVYGFGGIRVAVDSEPAPRFNGELMRGFGLRFDGAEWFSTTKPVRLGDVVLSRDLLIRRSGNYARFFDTFSNSGDRDVTIDVSFGGVLGLARGNTQSSVVGSSSGDTTIGTDDSWVTIATPTPGYSANSPSAVVLGTPAPFAGFTGVGDFQRDPFLTPLATTGQQANFYGFNDELTLRPGETRSLVRYFVVGLRETSGTAGQEVTTVSTAAARLAAAPDLGGLSSAQICSIANWDLTAVTIPGFATAECAAKPLAIAAPEKPAEPTTSVAYDVVGKSLTQLQADMTAGVTTSQEITRAYLDRIGAYDTGQFGFHAFITVADDAMAQAKAADEARAAGKRSAVLGVPVAIKDLYDTKDMPTTDGTAALTGYIPHDDAFQVGKLRDAGAVILGKANLSQFANSGSMSDSSFGQVWNAFKPSKSSLGSSGGSAVSVATSMAAFAMGTQTGVSLYAPSTGAGLATFRGTDGMQSAAGVMPLTWATDYAGTIARTVSDIAGILNVVAGTDPGDELTRDADAHKPADWTAYLDANALRGKTIGYLPAAFTGYAADDGTAGAIRDKLSLFTTAGARVVEMTAQPSAPTNTARGGNPNVEGWERYIEGSPEFPFANAAGILQSPRNLPYNRSGGTATGYDDENSARLLAYRAAYRAVIGRWMDDNGVDAIVYPGFLSDVWDNDGAGSHNGSDRATGVLTQGPGLPTSIVPVGFNPHGDPMTMQLMGREWADPQVLGMGYALEQVSGPRPQTTTAPALKYVPGATPRDPVIEVPAPPISNPPAQTPPEESRAPAARRVAIKVTVAKSAATKGGKVRFVLANRSAARVTGTVTLRVKLGKKTVVLGRAKVAVGARGRKTLVVTLTRAARRALGRRAKVSATATYALRNATGAKTTKTVKLAIRLR